VSECINYDGAVSTHGYGWRRFNGTQMHASRAAYIEAHGDIGDLHVLHKCGNRLCVNLEHLYLGSHSRNMKDRAMHGRQNNGKLTPELVKEIREAHKKGIPQSLLSKRYKISSGYTSALVNGMHWEDVK